ncbi:hypothetical protein Phi4:1_gp076 [Cellulophaga phage phi4:1]|uniref:Uncharacterized protein n=5 Tax=Lightbulbvirus TaxID=1918522 RepID=A0A0S2MWK6_9CAUD|nr:hypothetical protein Phi4:1_gp076 [Cellulophaga phage phi4:1]YP_008241573.1 hypothetical protein Phi17:2_gp078 [Cellulophaga phage phi17:2]ALO80085.1 hypothetical protein Phi4113_076 [Cellulophaga phage phi4:1_13]ALO80282.1 hypothetical protein Phi4118_076 [Cellulophaga phage phi4:1_18]ALO80481.1 hypothetical protein Phi17218_078 [Cellulophaga phage phi17:2_18]AGO47611.1 hypothetical protein Phi17:2_gp078 [Cellulophaga phage phi17:2]AGO49489.1 hypothetical protein Phi4:1_gp076 [Cellulophag
MNRWDEPGLENQWRFKSLGDRALRLPQVHYKAL